jgi:hypothetical protein
MSKIPGGTESAAVEGHQRPTMVLLSLTPNSSVSRQ